MKWIEPAIESISTSGIIFYSDSHRAVCERIGKVLKIEVFPDSNQKHFWSINDGWAKQDIRDDQKIKSNALVFDNNIIEKMMSAEGNILFSFRGNIMEGMLHFTNYDKQLVYQALYQNFYTYETNLRNYLSSMKYNYNDFEHYYEYKLFTSKREKDKEFYRIQLEKLKSKGFLDEAKQLGPLQRLDLRELMLFAKSSYHKPLKLDRIGLMTIALDDISELRNTVMHSKDFIGLTDNKPHDFETFHSFFKKVISFKKDFELLQNLRNKQKKEQKIRFNEYTLQQIGKMSDYEIEIFFYDRP